MVKQMTYRTQTILTVAIAVLSVGALLLALQGSGDARPQSETKSPIDSSPIVDPLNADEKEYVAQAVESFTEELEREGYKVVRQAGMLHVEIGGELHTSVEGPVGTRTFVDSAALDAIDIAEQADMCDPDKTVEGFTPEVHAKLVETGGNALPPCDGLVFTDLYVTLETGERGLPAIDGAGKIVGYWTGSSVRAASTKAD